MPRDDFDIARLAAYLHLTPQQVTRMADRGRLPGRKVSGQWVFSKAEIHHWLENRIGLSSEEELLDVEGVLARHATSGEEEIVLASFFPLGGIRIPLIARTRRSVIVQMSELAADTGLLWDPQKMAEAVEAREELHPTALDNGVALLHPRRPMTGILEEPFLAFGRTPQGLPFGASKGSLTDMFFLICSVDDRWHLRVLARLSRLLADDKILNALRDADDEATFRDAVVAGEETLA